MAVCKIQHPRILEELDVLIQMDLSVRIFRKILDSLESKLIMSSLSIQFLRSWTIEEVLKYKQTNKQCNTIQYNTIRV
jgi:hypothetical protein